MIPQQLSDFFIGGILFAAIIPVFQKRRAEADDQEASKDISALLNISFVILMTITVLFYLSVPFITKLVFSGFNDEKLLITIRYSRMLSPAILLFGFSLIYTSLYHAFRDFFVPSFAALMFPATSIAAICFLPSSLGIERLIYGNIAGTSLGLILLFIFMRKRISYKWNWNLKNPLITATILVSWPVLFENIFLKIIPLIKNKIASELPLNGAITITELALFVIGSITIFISGPISTAIFPFMGQQQAEKKQSELFETFIKSTNVILLFATPFNVILLTQSDILTEILYGYGKFSDADSLITSRLIMIMSLTILPRCIQSVLGRMFFVLQATRFPSFVSIGTVITTWPIYFVMARFFGIYGLMGALTLMTIFGALINLVILKIKFIDYSLSGLYWSFTKVVLSGIIMGSTVFLIRLTLGVITSYPIIDFCLFSFAGISTYAIFCRLLKLKELEYIVCAFLKTFKNSN